MRQLYKFILLINYKIRRFIYTFIAKLKCKDYQLPLRVNKKSNFTRFTSLGANTNFNGLNIKGSGVVKIGDNFHSGEECLMITQIHNYDTGQAVPYDATYITQDITIKNNVWFGDRVIVLGNVTIEEGAIIQAGSTVVTSIPKYAIAGGHPAKVFKYRDIEHYELLKQEGKFL